MEQPPPSVREAADANKHVQFPYREVPLILLLNKFDLVEQWMIEISGLRTQGLTPRG